MRIQQVTLTIYIVRLITSSLVKLLTNNMFIEDYFALLYIYLAITKMKYGTAGQYTNKR